MRHDSSPDESGAAASDRSGLDAAKAELISIGRRLCPEGLAIGTAGNLSIRVGDVVAITPSSIPYDAVELADVCVVSMASPDQQLDGRGAVSSEWPMHRAVYLGTNARAIAHTHSPEVVALSASCSELPAIHYAIVRFGGPVPVVGYSRFGSEGLAESAAAAMSGRKAVILQNHGAITHGRSLAEAYESAALLEWLAGVYRRAVQLGNPRILSTAELDEVTAEARRRRYGDHPKPVDS